MASNEFGSFKSIGQFHSKEIISQRATKYRSSRTGLTVVVVDTDGPLVHGNFVIATEAHDDDGCPHTLEHLVFMGSELYPYKGVLDSLANRCLADGTNAWTATDHTCYTISTAGSEGFLNILPVYLDHILYPTIHESAFNTEVHHITGSGEDAGVVYCEMSNHENSEESLIEREMIHYLYKDTGYSADTGGRVPNLRSLTVEKVRDYHKSYYRPENLCLVITGKINHSDLFDAIIPFEEKILSKGTLAPITRPWFTAVPPLEKTSISQIEFPTDDEEIGAATIAWRTVPFDNFEYRAAIDILFEYLTKGALSPLQQQLVEIEDPLCSDVSYDITTYSEGYIRLDFEGVDTEALDEIIPQVFDILKDVHEKGLDLERIHTIVERTKSIIIQQIENDPHHSFVEDIIEEFLYGTKPNEFHEALNWLPRYDELKKKPLSYWQDLLKTKLNKPYIAVTGKPSSALAKRLASEEEQRIANQRNTLGEAQLEALGKKLAEDIKMNEIPIPIELLQKVQLPDISKIPFFTISTYRTTSEEKSSQLAQHIESKSSSSQLPFEIQFDQTPSAFFKASVCIDTSSLPDNYRLYLEILRNLIFEVPIVRNGVQIDHEEIVRQLEQETIDSTFCVGCVEDDTFKAGNLSQLLWLSFRVEAKRYRKSIQWISELLKSSVFTAERLKIGVKRLLKDISDVKRDGSTMSTELLGLSTLDKIKSNRYAVSVVSQNKFLKQTMKQLKKSPKKVVEEFAKFLKALNPSHNLRFQVIGDILSIDDPLQPFFEFFEKADVKPSPFTKTYSNLISDVAKKPKNTGVVGGISSLEISFLKLSVPGPARFDDPNLPLIHLTYEYLTCLEGPFWKKIRGLGLSYGYGIYISVEYQQLVFYLYRSQDVGKAFEQAKIIIQDLASKKSAVDAELLISARGSAIYSVVSEQGTLTSTASTCFFNYLKGLPSNYQEAYVKRLTEITQDEIQEVLQKYIASLVADKDSSNVAITCNPSKAPEIIQAFAPHGISLENVLVESLFK